MNNKLKNIQEANRRFESRILIEQQSGEIKYSIQQNPQTKRFRIMVTTPKFRNPTDAETVFGKAQNWINYTTQAEAQKVIDSLVKSSQSQNTQQQPSTQQSSEPQADFGKSSAQSGVPQSDFGELQKEEFDRIKKIMGII